MEKVYLMQLYDNQQYIFLGLFLAAIRKTNK